VLADAVSMMPLGSYTMRGDIRVPTAPPSLLRQPSADATTGEWIYMILVSLLLRGNLYGRIVGVDSTGKPSQIELLHPDNVSARLGDDGRMHYFVKGVEVPAKSIWHVRAFRMPGSSLGLSPIAYAARVINTESAAADFALGYFRDGAHPSAILSADATFSEEQARTIKQRFVASVEGREPAVLSGGLKYDAIQVSPEESQFLATQRYGLTQIARIYGVPPEMIGGEAGNSMTYANVEQRSIDFLTYSVQPWLTRIEAALSALMLGQRHVRFDTSVLTRTDFLTLMQSTAIGIASKQMTPDEARAKRDDPPLTEQQKNDLLHIPLDVSPLGKPRSAPTSTPAPAQGEPA
jgi:HK97 family phage portal protein